MSNLIVNQWRCLKGLFAKSDKHYLRITRRDQQDANQFKRTEIILFEDDLGFFVEAVSILLGRYSSGTMGISC